MHSYINCYGVCLVRNITQVVAEWAVQPVQKNGISYSYASSVTADTGGIYITGYFSDTIGFGIYTLNLRNLWGCIYC